MSSRSRDSSYSSLVGQRAGARPNRARKRAAYTILVAVLSFSAGAEPRVLRVAADPNNLPFSNERREGFENKIVELVAADLGATVEYLWRAQRRGFFRETLKEQRADLVASVPRGFDLALTTAPYYRSTYVFVFRAERGMPPRSFDDPALRKLTIGVQMIGDDFANTPPAHALSRRGIVDNVRGFTIYGDYRESNPPARIIDAVVRGEIDVACVWGPLGGYFARQHGNALVVIALPSRDTASAQPLAFDICMGVRKGNVALRAELDAALARKRAEIDAILAEYGVPRVDTEGAVP
jgi:mxaJ protein